MNQWGARLMLLALAALAVAGVLYLLYVLLPFLIAGVILLGLAWVGIKYITREAGWNRDRHRL